MAQVVVVTGGGRGIGRAIAASFAEQGDRVVINYSRSAAAAEALQAELASRGCAVSLFQADVADFGQVQRMMSAVVAEHGSIDVLVNNAGITRDSLLMFMAAEEWRDVVEVNLTGVFNCSKAVTEHMISRRSGAIVNVSSLSGIAGLPGQTNYAAAKGGVIAFTRALSKELARFGIRVNAVAPGIIETEMSGTLTETAKAAFLEHVPLRRFGRPEEVASVVKFLASDGASYITGETICIAGGLH